MYIVDGILILKGQDEKSKLYCAFTLSALPKEGRRKYEAEKLLTSDDAFWLGFRCYMFCRFRYKKPAHFPQTVTVNERQLKIYELDDREKSEFIRGLNADRDYMYSQWPDI